MRSKFAFFYQKLQCGLDITSFCESLFKRQTRSSCCAVASRSSSASNLSLLVQTVLELVFNRINKLTDLWQHARVAHASDLHCIVQADEGKGRCGKRASSHAYPMYLLALDKQRTRSTRHIRCNKVCASHSVPDLSDDLLHRVLRSEIDEALLGLAEVFTAPRSKLFVRCMRRDTEVCARFVDLRGGGY